MRQIDDAAIKAAGERRFRSEYDYAVFEYLRSAKVIQALERAGVKVAERVPCIVPPQQTTEDYLRTKKEKLGHLF